MINPNCNNNNKKINLKITKRPNNKIHRKIFKKKNKVHLITLKINFRK